MKLTHQLLIAAVLLTLLGATTAPSTMPSTQPSGFCISYIAVGGIAGKVQKETIASQDFKFDNEPHPLVRATPLQATAIIELLEKESVMQWPDGITGRGSWNDNMHYYLDMTLNGQAKHIHTASDGDTQAEASQMQDLMKKIDAIIAGK